MDESRCKFEAFIGMTVEEWQAKMALLADKTVVGEVYRGGVV